MIHLVVCPHHLAYGGTQLSVLHWLRHLNPQQYRVTILAMSRGGLSELFEAHWPVIYDAEGYPRITEILADLQPDLVHCCPPGGRDNPYITQAALIAPVTQTIMCPRPAANLDKVCGTAVISEYVRMLQSPQVDVTLIELPYDPAVCPEGGFDRAHFGLPEDTLLVGSFGNHRLENAHFMKLVRDFDGDGVHFAIRSDIRYPYWRGRKRITVMRKRFDEAEKISFFKLLDVFLYPTTNEAYGLVFLEAMAQKVPVVSYANSAISSTVSVGGLLASGHDRLHLRMQLDRLLGDADLRHRLGKDGAALVAERNDPRRIATEYDTFFRNSLARAASRYP